ncbi:MAG: nitrilase-related carbon-nitrogen hydrolase [Candidatus Altiarchaeota archaeon]
MKVGFIQTDPGFMRVEDNVVSVVEKIKSVDADLLVLPEMFNTGYNFEKREDLEKVAEPTPSGYTTKALIDVSKETGTAIAAGLPERGDDGKLYNSAVLVDGNDVHLYRKTHIFHEEKKLFSDGDTGFNVFDISGVKVGLMVCYDWIFPEAARTLALKGAQIIAHPANLILPYCQDAMLTRSLENRVYSVTANRIGTEGHLTFTGASQIIDTKGKILFRAKTDAEDTKVVEVDPKKGLDKNFTTLNHLFEDRRPDLYEL